MEENNDRDEGNQAYSPKDLGNKIVNELLKNEIISFDSEDQITTAKINPSGESINVDSEVKNHENTHPACIDDTIKTIMSEDKGNKTCAQDHVNEEGEKKRNIKVLTDMYNTDSKQISIKVSSLDNLEQGVIRNLYLFGKSLEETASLTGKSEEEVLEIEQSCLKSLGKILSADKTTNRVNNPKPQKNGNLIFQGKTDVQETQNYESMETELDLINRLAGKYEKDPEDVKKAIKNLKDKEKTVFDLFSEGKTTREIEESTGIREGDIFSVYDSALKIIEEKIGFENFARKMEDVRTRRKLKRSKIGIGKSLISKKIGHYKNQLMLDVGVSEPELYRLVDRLKPEGSNIMTLALGDHDDENIANIIGISVSEVNKLKGNYVGKIKEMKEKNSKRLEKQRTRSNLSDIVGIEAVIDKAIKNTEEIPAKEDISPYKLKVMIDVGVDENTLDKYVNGFRGEKGKEIITLALKGHDNGYIADEVKSTKPRVAFFKNYFIRKIKEMKAKDPTKQTDASDIIESIGANIEDKINQTTENKTGIPASEKINPYKLKVMINVGVNEDTLDGYVGRLSKRGKEVIALAFKGYSIKKICDELNMNSKNVYMHRTRAIKNIKKMKAKDPGNKTADPNTIGIESTTDELKRDEAINTIMYNMVFPGRITDIEQVLNEAVENTVEISAEEDINPYKLEVMKKIGVSESTLDKYILHLNPKRKKAMTLAFTGHDDRYIADNIGVKVSAVYSLKHNSIKTIKKMKLEHPEIIESIMIQEELDVNPYELKVMRETGIKDRSMLKEYVGRLSGNRNKVMELAFEGHDDECIAGKINVRVSAVYSLKHNSIKSIKEMKAEDLKELKYENLKRINDTIDYITRNEDVNIIQYDKVFPDRAISIKKEIHQDQETHVEDLLKNEQGCVADNQNPEHVKKGIYNSLIEEIKSQQDMYCQKTGSRDKVLDGIMTILSSLV